MSKTLVFLQMALVGFRTWNVEQTKLFRPGDLCESRMLPYLRNSFCTALVTTSFHPAQMNHSHSACTMDVPTMILLYAGHPMKKIAQSLKNSLGRRKTTITLKAYLLYLEIQAESLGLKILYVQNHCHKTTITLKAYSLYHEIQAESLGLKIQYVQNHCHKQTTNLKLIALLLKTKVNQVLGTIHAKSMNSIKRRKRKPKKRTLPNHRPRPPMEKRTSQRTRHRRWTRPKVRIPKSLRKRRKKS